MKLIDSIVNDSCFQLWKWANWASASTAMELPTNVIADTFYRAGVKMLAMLIACCLNQNAWEKLAWQWWVCLEIFAF